MLIKSVALEIRFIIQLSVNFSLEFVKNLSPSEAKYKYLGLPKNIREEFPEKDEPFKTRFKGKTFDLKVNNKNSIMLTQLYYTYQFQENDEIKIIKKKENQFEISVNPAYS